MSERAGRKGTGRHSRRGRSGPCRCAGIAGRRSGRVTPEPETGSEPPFGSQSAVPRHDTLNWYRKRRPRPSGWSSCVGTSYCCRFCPKLPRCRAVPAGGEDIHHDVGRGWVAYSGSAEPLTLNGPAGASAGHRALITSQGNGEGHRHISVTRGMRVCRRREARKRQRQHGVREIPGTALLTCCLTA
jgi:hypothetical protein